MLDLLVKPPALWQEMATLMFVLMVLNTARIELSFFGFMVMYLSVLTMTTIALGTIVNTISRNARTLRMFSRLNVLKVRVLNATEQNTVFV